MTGQPLLSVENLVTRFYTSRGVVGAVEDVSFEVEPGEAIGIVGESGSGKSVTALSILGLVPMPGRVVGGRVLFRGRDVLSMRESELLTIRRNDISMVFQDPSNFLNPIEPIGEQIAEGINDPDANRETIRSQVIAALQAVHIPEPAQVANYYPFQMSGGMQQRAVIAAAVARRPSLIIADEPTTALDATVQYEILRLLAELQAKLGTALIIISHDLAVIASVCSRVYVMYASEIVESGPTEAVYRSPAHPYTRALLGSILDPLERKRELFVLEGSIPDLSAPPPGCRFHPRCPSAMPVCEQESPPEFAIGDQGQTASCWLYDTAREGVA